MEALKLIGHGSPGRYELGATPDPRPAPNEIVLKVRACGLNHLDLWHEAGELPIPLTVPRIPGCEVAGEILEAGPEVKMWKPGDRVVVTSNLSCGVCEYCAIGEESMCLGSVMFGVQRDGGLAEKASIPARPLVRIPDAVSFEAAASLALAGSTAMHMLTHRTEVKQGQWVLVMGGASGVGSAAIQIARSLGARVISTGSTPEKRDLAVRLGAEHAVDSNSEKWPSEVRRITNKRGVDLVVEHVGGKVLGQVFTCLARGGTVVTCGATAGAEVMMNLWPFFVKQHRLIGSYSRNTKDLATTMEWIALGRLRPVIDKVYPLSGAEEALARLRSRSVLGKVVVAPVPLQ